MNAIYIIEVLDPLKKCKFLNSIWFEALIPQMIMILSKLPEAIRYIFSCEFRARAVILWP